MAYTVSFNQICLPLSWRHSVPKYTPDGHTNMKILISREVGPDKVENQFTTEETTIPT